MRKEEAAEPVVQVQRITPTTIITIKVLVDVADLSEKTLWAKHRAAAMTS